MSELLMHKGRPVPYITAWSGEQVLQPPVIVVGGGIAYAGPTPGRGSAGLLWKPWAINQGVGEPLWKVVHGPRQRRAMRKFLCQVCGGPADRDKRGWLWLLEDHRDEGPKWPHGEMTVHPPVCRSCAPVAARLCPHLRREGVVPVRVGDVILDAVYGQRFYTGPLGLVGGEMDVFLMTSWRARWVVGGQLAASLARCTVLDPAEVGIETPAPREAVGR
ncbi:hypothetical protein [Streptomyces sp. BK340]|uniref:hypothetical protein n=1 Tax=Streptomyces sp. BK340 TaxID=2572903 RepID=UPI0011A72A97|nr:hypothetical protein [Streptomyces sp. BK340]TVZ84851.1 hypothetical protein FB157_120118 [Streptomyces sp. BK340]